jgi:uncharacterized protein (DUF3820 family)
MSPISIEERLSRIERWLIRASEWETTCNAVRDLRDQTMPFGKYEGKTLGEIPLRYLDQTVSTMPDTHIVRLIKKFVSCAVEVTCLEFQDTGMIPNSSFDEMSKNKGGDD